MFKRLIIEEILDRGTEYYILKSVTGYWLIFINFQIKVEMISVSICNNGCISKGYSRLTQIEKSMNFMFNRILI